MEENFLIIVMSVWTLAFLIATFRIFWEEYGPSPKRWLQAAGELWLDSRMHRGHVIIRLWLSLTVIHVASACFCIFAIVNKFVLGG